MGNLERNRKILIITGLIIAFLLLLMNLPFSERVDILKKIPDLNITEDTIALISKADCTHVEKYREYLVVNRCKGDVYFKLFLKDNDYYLGVCTSWKTPREAVLKLKDYIGGCIDLNVEDKDITLAGMKVAGLRKYSVCGREIVFKDECVVSWGK